MTLTTKSLIVFILITTPHCIVYAQDEPTDDPRVTTSLGLTLSAPINPTAKAVDLGFGLQTGVGYNFTRRHAVIGEFMWNHLYANSQALNQIRTALQNPSVDGSGDLIAFTGNYRFELRGKVVGTYLIGGGGWYHRSAGLSQTVTISNPVVCTPIWLWYGFSCGSGVVTADQTIKSTSSNALGANGGIGFTARVGEAPYRVYVESRYHYAPNRGISTQLVVISAGIRY